jgi:hypothetical protein
MAPSTKSKNRTSLRDCGGRAGLIGTAPGGCEHFNGLHVRMVVGLLACVLCLTCLAIAPQSLRASGPPKAQKQKVDLSFIHTGITTRDEVIQKLGWADAGIKSEQMFLARWSMWGNSNPVLVMFEGKAARFQNLMIEFDSQGIVQAFRPIQEKNLAQELSDWASRSHQPLLDLSTPIKFSVFDSTGPGVADLILEKDFVKLREPHDGLQVPPGEISEIISSRFGTSDPSFTMVTVSFPKLARKPGIVADGSVKLKTRRGFLLQLHPADLLTLMRYFKQTRPATP